MEGGWYGSLPPDNDDGGHMVSLICNVVADYPITMHPVLPVYTVPAAAPIITH